jgi:hypothetical protein
VAVLHVIPADLDNFTSLMSLLQTPQKRSERLLGSDVTKKLSRTAARLKTPVEDAPGANG